jgi:hypothetical protein
LPTLLTSSSVTDEQRQQHDRHRSVVVIATLLLLFVYMYLFTRVSAFIGLPSPKELADYLHITIPYIFDRELNVGTQLYVHHAREFAHIDDSLLILLLIVAVAFVSAYYLPLRYKQGSLAFWSILAVGLLYGQQAVAALLMAHLIVFLVFHPDDKQGLWLSAAAGLAGYLAFTTDSATTNLQIALLLLLPLLAMAGYRYVILRLLEHQRIAGVLRAVVIHAVILTIFINLIIDVLGGVGIMVPLGVMLFFFQWARLVMYHIDYQDGLVPGTLSLDRYLAVFLSPGVLPAWYWAVTIPQGYAYINSRFLCTDKNRIVIDGIKLLGIALLYLVFWLWAIRQLDQLFSNFGLEVNQTSTRVMIHRFTRGADIDTVSVLLTTLLDIVETVLVFVGVAHFKVGVWRICGYHIEPYFNKPWLATNLMAFWTRYGYYYREFLVRAFYYPVFFRFAKLPAVIRIMLASLAAAGLGNLITHLIKQNLQHGMHTESFSYVLSTWPYFLLLGLGIGVSMIFMRRRKHQRKPWTLDRWFIVDLLSVYVTIQYFALIHIFARPTEASSLTDLFMLFMLGLGFDLR